MKTQAEMAEAVCDYFNTEILEEDQIGILDLLDVLASLGLALTTGNVSEDYVAAIKVVGRESRVSETRRIVVEVPAGTPVIPGDSVFVCEPGVTGTVVSTTDPNGAIEDWEAWARRSDAHLRGACRTAYKHGATEDEIIHAMLRESDLTT